MEISTYDVDKLERHADIDAGFAFKSDRFSENKDDVPLVKGENVKQGHIDWGISKYWPRADVFGLEKFWLNPNDIVVAMDRPWVTAGLKWSYIKVDDPKALLVQRVARLRARESLDQTYLRYLIGSNYFSNYIKPIVTGVNVPHISARQIGSFVIPIPSLLIQKKIAAILSAYDDLIENNNKRIALHERAAEEIYREWFVRLRFPGWETAVFHKGIPEGWRFSSLSEMYPNDKDIVKTGPFGSKLHAHDYRDVGVPLILVKHVKDGQIVEQNMPLVGDHKVVELDAYRLKEGDIVVTRVGYVGEAAYIHKRSHDWLFSGQMLRVRISDRRFIQPRYLAQYYQTATFRQMIENYAVGATRLSLNTSILASMPLLVPPMDVQDVFVENVSPIDGALQNLKRSNFTLRHIRDLLLSRLISGRLPVDDLDIHFPPSMMAEEPAGA